jgi:SPP1 gp7 family putative phage head morphogenesis protein
VPAGGTSENGPADATKLSVLQRKFKGPALIHAFRQEAIPTWKLHAHQLLTHDADQIAGIVESLITDSVHKSLQSKAHGHDRAMAGVNRYLEEDSKSRWTTTFGPMYSKASTRAGAVIGAEMDINFNLIHSNLLKFARQNTGAMITDITETTRTKVNEIIRLGLEEGKTATEIAQMIREDTAFSQVRSQLIARTETTKAFNGAPTDSLKEYGAASGRVFTKTWSGVLDDRERDEHVEMEGETVGIDDVFSNGEDYPGEPNCRCTVIFNEEEA